MMGLFCFDLEEVRFHENNVTSEFGVQCNIGGTPMLKNPYRKTFSISRTKSQNLNVSCILLQLSSLNPLKPGVKLGMKM